MTLAVLLLTGCSAEFPGQAVLSANPTERFGLRAEVEVDAPLQLWVEDQDGVVVSPPVSVAAGSAVLPVRGLLPGQAHELAVVASDGDQSWSSPAQALTIAPAPADWPDCTLTVPDDAGVLDEDDVICTNGVLSDETLGMVYCVDREGRPRWAVEHPGGAQLRVLEPTSGGGFASVSMSTGKASRFDALGEMTAEVSITRFQSQTRFVHEWIDPHEVIQLHDGPWAGALALLTVASDTVQIDGVDETRLAYGILVYEPDSETVLWDWSAHGVLGDDEPIDPALDYDRLGVSATLQTDFMHANALVHHVEPDGSQRFTMSLRHQDWVIEVDVHTDAIAWTLGHEGDFVLVDDLDADEPVPLPAGDWFTAQHSPAWTRLDGDRRRLLLYDNGKGRIGSSVDWSRVLELEIDLTRGLAAPVFTWGSDQPSDPDFMFAAGGGDVDLLPDGRHLLVLKGWDAAFAAVLSYPEGQVRWRRDCVDADDFDESYRARHASDLYALDGWGDTR